jgi:hypothetical protein
MSSPTTVINMQDLAATRYTTVPSDEHAPLQQHQLSLSEAPSTTSHPSLALWSCVFFFICAMAVVAGLCLLSDKCFLHEDLND